MNSKNLLVFLVSLVVSLSGTGTGAENRRDLPYSIGI